MKQLVDWLLRSHRAGVGKGTLTRLCRFEAGSGVSVMMTLTEVEVANMLDSLTRSIENQDNHYRSMRGCGVRRPRGCRS